MTHVKRPRRAKGEGSIIQRGKASWAIKLNLGTDPNTGKRRTKWHTVKGTKREAQKECRRLLAEIERGTYRERSPVTVGEHLRTWLETRRPHVRARTFERYGEIVEHYLIPRLGNLPLQSLGWSHIEKAWAEALASGRRDGTGGLSPQTVKHMHRTLSAALKYAVKRNLIPSNPAAQVETVRVPKREMTALTPEQAITLLEALAGTQVYLPVFLALTTGMRRSEILGLRWCDVNLEASTLSVVQVLQHSDEGLTFAPPKTETSRRTIILPPLAVDELAARRAQAIENHLALGVGFDEKSLVVCRLDGKPLQPRSLTHEFTRMTRRVRKLPRVRFHDLRHTHITHLLQAGESAQVVQHRAGHSSVQTTIDIYGHLTTSMQQGAADKIDGVLRTAMERNHRK